VIVAMEAKSNVVKSKSSNITTRAEYKNKKSRSSAEFQKNALKKRGVYVEKKNSKMTSDEPGELYIGTYTFYPRRGSRGISDIAPRRPRFTKIT
jgi:hypothetical protein